jgi:hypothetical protein
MAQEPIEFAKDTIEFFREKALKEHLDPITVDQAYVNQFYGKIPPRDYMTYSPSGDPDEIVQRYWETFQTLRDQDSGSQSPVDPPEPNQQSANPTETQQSHPGTQITGGVDEVSEEGKRTAQLVFNRDKPTEDKRRWSDTTKVTAAIFNMPAVESLLPEDTFIVLKPITKDIKKKYEDGLISNSVNRANFETLMAALENGEPVKAYRGKSMTIKGFEYEFESASVTGKRETGIVTKAHMLGKLIVEGLGIIHSQGPGTLALAAKTVQPKTNATAAAIRRNKVVRSKYRLRVEKLAELQKNAAKDGDERIKYAQLPDESGETEDKNLRSEMSFKYIKKEKNEKGDMVEKERTVRLQGVCKTFPAMTVVEPYKKLLAKKDVSVIPENPLENYKELASAFAGIDPREAAALGMLKQQSDYLNEMKQAPALS